MARRRRRDHTPIANDPLSLFTRPARSPSYNLTFSDTREYHPEAAYRPLLSFDDTPVTITSEDQTHVRKPRRSSGRVPINRASSPGRLVFAEAPAKASSRTVQGIPECVRREQRREVIFAKGHGGSPHRRKVRRNPNSKIGC